jgi:hypothetical protein
MPVTTLNDLHARHSPPPAPDSESRRSRCCARMCHLSIPISALVSCVCVVVLVVGFITTGVFTGGAILIPVAVLGGVAVCTLIGGSLCSSCRRGEAEGPGDRPRRGFRRRGASQLSLRQRMEIVQRLPHTADVPEEARTCSICLSEDPPGRVVLNCGHLYHEDCVKEWMARARFPRCPLCREGLTTPPRAVSESVPHPSGDNEPLPV